MCVGVLEVVLRRAGGRTVSRIGVRAGAQLRVAPDAFAHSFALVAAGTLAEGATAELTVVPAICSCRDCGEGFATHDPVPGCPACGSVRIAREGGDELALEWIECGDPPGAAAAEGA